jgi:hypothetical protein
MSLALQTRTVRLRDRVAESEADLRLALRDLEVAARRAVDFRHWMASHPWYCVSGAVLLGAWLGGRRR